MDKLPEEDKVLLAMKALLFNDGKPYSPSHDAEWSKDGFIFAACPMCRRPVADNPSCTCGIYATTSRVIIESYIRNKLIYLSPVVLVSACGETEVWSSGWRAEAAQVIYVIDFPWKDYKKRNGIIATELASRYFELEVIPYDYAIYLIEASWDDCGYSKMLKSRPNPKSDVYYTDSHNHLGFRKKRGEGWVLDVPAE